jgi:hypothetical protein
MLIAASIVWLTLENIVLPADRLEHRWMMAFGFGLIHGFGFSFALAEQLQFAGGHLLMALASFNVGVELGQVLVLALALPVLGWLHRRVGADRERMLTIVGSALVAHTAWHWMTERFETLRSYRFEWPALDLSLAVGGIRLLMGLLIVGGIAWALSGVMTRLATPRARGSALAPRRAVAQRPSTMPSQAAGLARQHEVHRPRRAVARGPRPTARTRRNVRSPHARPGVHRLLRQSPRAGCAARCRPPTRGHAALA